MAAQSRQLRYLPDRQCCPCPALPACLLQLLGVLRGALALQAPQLAEPALSCMHKLVAYAYMQGETSPSGRLDDEHNIVAQVGAHPSSLLLAWPAHQRCCTV